MFALTVKNGLTRIYLTDGTANPNGIASATASNFWRTDNGNLSAAALLASQASGSGEPNPANTYPTMYNAGWQKLTSKTTSSPYFATDDFCWAQCWYDEDVYTPAGMPDTVYVIGANQYGEQPCDTKGVERPRGAVLEHGGRSRCLGEPADVHGSLVRRSEPSRLVVRVQAVLRQRL